MIWNAGQPINRTAPLNRGLLYWWLSTPVAVSNSRWIDLVTGPGIAGATANFNGQLLRGSGSRRGGYGAVSFDGSTGAATAANLISPQAHTIALWCNAISTTANQILFHIKSASTGFYFSISSFTSGDLDWVWEGTSVRSTTSLGLTTGVWHHLAVTADTPSPSNLVEIYVDGQSVLSVGGPAATWAETTGATGYIGRSSADTLRFGGILDDIRFYNRQLQAAEIMRLYQASSAGYRYELNWSQDEAQELRAVAAVAAGRRKTNFFFFMPVNP